MKLIIVEDMPDLLFILKEKFETLGFEIVATASTMDEAIQVIKTIEADVILLDVMLTKDGYEGLDILAECSDYTKADIFICSSVTIPGIMETCYALGAFYYVDKMVILSNPEIVKLALKNRQQQDVLNKKYINYEYQKILSKLANREVEALKLKEIGFTNTEIAKQMCIEKSTVNKMISKAYAKIKDHPTGKFIKRLFSN